MSSPVTRFKTRSVRALLAIGGSTLLSGCALFTQTFSQTVDPDERARVLAQVRVGMPMDQAESNILSLGYRCSSGHGSFIDEAGAEQEAAQFLSCVERPGRIEFACLNRNQVYVIPSIGKASAIHITRGPTCVRQ